MILVYDVRAPQSFDQVKKYWLTELKENMEHNENVFVAVNKCDEYDENPSQEQIDFIEERAMRWYRVSAKQGTNVAEMFEEITEILIDRFPPTEKKSHQSIILQESMREQIVNQKRCCK